MTTQDLDLAINRLMVGYTILDYDKTVVYKNPTPETRYRTSILLKRFVDQHRFDFKKRVELEWYFIACGILEASYKDKIKNLQDQIDELKYQLFEVGPLVEQEKKIRIKLKIMKSNLDEYFSSLSQTFYYSKDDVLNRISVMYNILLNCFYENQVSVFDIDSIDYNLYRIVSNKIQDASLSMSDIRKIARSNEWRSYWSRGKERCFSCPINCLNDEQRLLCSYSTMYDNALSRSDFPEYILNDDDKFDGWLIKQRRDAEDDRKQQTISGGQKHHDFIFKQASTQEEANNVYQMNTRQGLQQIKTHAKNLEKRNIGSR